MKSSKAVLGLAVALLVSSTIIAAGTKPKLDGVKCLLQGGKAASESKAVEWKEGKVYFCCDNCVKAFTADKEKNAVKANAQLVATEQYKQQACPISGGKLDDSTAIEVGGTKVAFCCNNCKGSVEKVKGDKQLAVVFSEDAFKKAKFEVVKEEKK